MASLRGWRAFGAIFPLLFWAACSASHDPSTSETRNGGKAGLVDESTPPLRPDWPLGGVWMASGLDPDGAIVDPRLIFTTDDVEATAVVALGKEVPEGATLFVHWFRTNLGERVLLFTHAIPVGPGGLALSHGAAPPGFAPGSYEVVAVLGEHQTRTPWVVRVADRVGLTGANGTEGGLAQPASAPEEWETPTDDGYDWTGDGGTGLGSPSPPGPCALGLVSGRFTPLTAVYGVVTWTGTCADLTIAAGVSGSPVTIYSADVSQDENSIDSSPSVEVCDLPGGSDMPGTVVRFETAMDELRAVDDLVLEDMGRAVAADVNSNPPPSSSIEAGQTIELRAIGMQFAPALGIRWVKLFADGREIGAAGNSSGTTEPTACDGGRFYAFLAGQYTVPDPAPPTIEICAVAMTFDGFDNRGCIRFYTGQVWSGGGDLTSSVVYPGGGGTCTDAVTMDFTFGVGDDGTVTGSGLATHTQEAQCSFPNPGEQWETTMLSVSGQLDGSTVKLRFRPAGTSEPEGGIDFGGFGPVLALGDGSVDLAIQGTSASGSAAWSVQSGHPPATYTASGPVTATCSSGCGGG